MIFVLGTPAAPEQFILRTRNEAVAQALAFANRQRVGAWFANGGDELVLLDTFQKETVISPGKCVGEMCVSTESSLAGGCGTAAEYGDARTRPIAHVGSAGVGCLPT